MIAKCVDGNATHLKIFTGRVVSRDHSLHFITQGLIERTLASNRCASCCFGTASSFQNLTTTSRTHPSHLSDAFALG